MPGSGYGKNFTGTAGGGSWVNLSGKPFVTVSPIGTAQGKPVNNGANYGPDTPGTTTSGIQEAINASVGGGRIQLVAGTYLCGSALVVPALAALRIEGPLSAGWQADEYPYAAYQTANDPGGAILSFLTLGSGTAITITVNPAHGGIAGSKIDLVNFNVLVPAGVSGIDIGGLWYGIVDGVQVTTDNVAHDPGSAFGIKMSNSGAGKVLIQDCVTTGFSIGHWTVSNNLTYLNCEANWCGVGFYNQAYGVSYIGCHDFGCGTSYVVSGGQGAINILGHQREPNTTPVRATITTISPSGHNFIGFLDQISVGCLISIDGLTVVAPFTAVESYLFFSFNPNTGPGNTGYPWLIEARNLSYPSALSLQSTAAVITNPPANVTWYAMTYPRGVVLMIPVVFNPTGGAAATFQVNLSPDGSTNITNLPQESEPAGLTQGIVKNYRVRVPSGWFWQVNMANVSVDAVVIEPEQ